MIFLFAQTFWWPSLVIRTEISGVFILLFAKFMKKYYDSRKSRDIPTGFRGCSIPGISRDIPNSHWPWCQSGKNWPRPSQPLLCQAEIMQLLTMSICDWISLSPTEFSFFCTLLFLFLLFLLVLSLFLFVLLLFIVIFVVVVVVILFSSLHIL